MTRRRGEVVSLGLPVSGSKSKGTTDLSKRGSDWRHDLGLAAMRKLAG